MSVGRRRLLFLLEPARATPVWPRALTLSPSRPPTRPATPEAPPATAGPSTRRIRTPPSPPARRTGQLTGSTSASFSFSGSDNISLPADLSFQCKLDGASFAPCTSPAAYTDLSAGSHTFSVKATDQAGNTDATPDTRTWTIDTTAPDTTIDTTPSNPTNQTTAAFTFHSSEAGSTFECQLDTGGFASCTSPASYNSLTDGSHTFQVRASDAGGNTDQSPASYTWVVDTTAPDTVIDTAPPALTIATSASFTFHSTEPVDFQCSLDGAAYSACTSPASYNSLTDGSHTFAVKATDAAGNTDASPASFTWVVDTVAPPAPSITVIRPTRPTRPRPPSASPTPRVESASSAVWTRAAAPARARKLPRTACRRQPHLHSRSHRRGGQHSLPASYTWSIDTTAPDTVIDSGPTSPTSSTSASFTFHSTEAGSSFLCSLDGVTPAPCASPASYSSLSAGSHSFTVAATDAAGNTDRLPASFSWTIDLTGPDVTINSVPPNPTNQTSANFGFQSADPTATFECQLDTGGFTACTSPQFYPGPLSEGPHTFSVRARDLAGNVSSPASFTWVVDLTAPSTTIQTAPPAYTTSNSATFTFVGSEGGTCLCQLDWVGNFESCSPSGQTYSGLAQGSHTFRVEETDAAGNTGSPTSYSWAVDTTAPDTTITAGPANGSSTSSTSASFSFTGSDNISLPGNLTFECQLDGASFSTCTSPISYSSLTAGSHTFRSEPRTRPATQTRLRTHARGRWTRRRRTRRSRAGRPMLRRRDLRSPSASAPTRRGLSSASSMAPASLPALHRRLTAASPTAATPSRCARGPGGQHRATPDSRTWTVDATGPVTTSSSPTSGSTTGPSVSVTFSANETATFQCKLDGGGYAACTSPQPYGGLSGGSHTVSVKGTESYGNIGAVASVTWTVDATAPNTTITSSPPNPSSSSSASFSFTSSEPGSTFECKLDPAAFASCGSPQVYSGLADGSHTFWSGRRTAYGNTDASSGDLHLDGERDGAAGSDDHERAAESEQRQLAELSFTDTEAGVTFQCSLDGGCLPGLYQPQELPQPGGRSHTFAVKAKDTAGNFESGHELHVDGGQDGASGSDDHEQAAEPDQSDSRRASASPTPRRGSASSASWMWAATSPAPARRTMRGRPGGSHTFSVTAKDAAGNTELAGELDLDDRDDASDGDDQPASGQADPTSVSPINFTVVFSESVSDFATGDVTLSGTAGATTATVTGSGTTYNVAVSGMTSNGTVIASLAAGVAHDAAGNASTASTSTDNTVTFTLPSAPSISSFSPTSGQSELA